MIGERWQFCARRGAEGGTGSLLKSATTVTSLHLILHQSIMRWIGLVCDYFVAPDDSAAAFL